MKLQAKKYDLKKLNPMAVWIIALKAKRTPELTLATRVLVLTPLF